MQSWADCITGTLESSFWKRQAAKRGWISEQQRASLEQLWEHRNNLHLKFLENSEHDLYQVEHVNAPHAAVLDLMAKSKAWHAARQA